MKTFLIKLVSSFLMLSFLIVIPHHVVEGKNLFQDENPVNLSNEELINLIINDAEKNNGGYSGLIHLAAVKTYGNYGLIDFYQEGIFEGEIALMNFSSEGWTVFTSFNSKFNQMLELLPDTLLSKENKNFFFVNEQTLETKTTYTGHKLPWEGGITHRVSQSPSGSGHTGMSDWAYDFSVNVGTPLWASKSGTVVYVKENSSLGACDSSYANYANYVVINNDGDDSATLYLHLNTNGAAVSVGQHVNQGDLVGYSGQTGYSCGAHLHFQVQARGASWWTQSQRVIFDSPIGEPATDTYVVSNNYRTTPTANCSNPTSSEVYVCDPQLTPTYNGNTCTSYWYRFTGYENHNAFVTLNAHDTTTSSNSGIWRPNLPTNGTYEIFAYVGTHGNIDRNCGWTADTVSIDTNHAKYKVYNGSTLIREVDINQYPLSNQWVSLGQFNLNSGTSGYVKLTDVTGETRISHNVSFGAMRFKLIQPANNPVPTISGISPATVVTTRGDFELIVNGTNFIDGSVVRFNGSDRATTFVSSTRLTASINASDITTIGTKNITVFTPSPGGGLSNTSTLSVQNPLPSISSLSPTSKNTGSGPFTLTVNGTGFVNTSVVLWNGVDQPTSYVNSTQLTAAIPATNITQGSVVTITVNNPAPGGGTSASSQFTVNNPQPVISSISPDSANTGEGDFTLTVTGENFVSNSVVKWNGNDQPTTYVNSTQISANISASKIASEGTASVTVFNPAPAGGNSNSLTFTINFFQPEYNTNWMSDTTFTSEVNTSVGQIRAFLKAQNSCLANEIQDVDGQTIDVPALIAAAAVQHQINPKVFLATMQKEQSAISQCPNNTKLAFLMGAGTPSTARQQINFAASIYRAYLTEQETNSSHQTRSGWAVGLAKMTQDGVEVTPASKAIAGLFTYTPYAGVQWGGSMSTVGGTYLFKSAWEMYNFDEPFPPVSCYGLSVIKNPEAGGIVNIQTPYSPECGTDEFVAGTVVQVSVSPNLGYSFTAWTGDVSSTNSGIQVTMDSEKQITANFEQNCLTLSVQKNPVNGGNVVFNTPFNCGSGGFQMNTVVSITAIPNVNYGFSSWTRDLSGTNPNQTITMNTNHSVAANFTLEGDPDGPQLALSQNVPGFSGGKAKLDLTFSGAEHLISSTSFSIDYDESCLSLSSTDSNHDGIPDAIELVSLPGLSSSVAFDASDTDGEIDIVIADFVAPLVTLPDGKLMEINFDITCTPTSEQNINAAVNFSQNPTATFGNNSGASVLGDTVNGNVVIQAGQPGDANGDTQVDAGDISALVLEIFDGDGGLAVDVPNGSFPGNVIGSDPNQDSKVDAGDISCLVLIIFNGDGACAAQSGDDANTPAAKDSGTIPELSMPNEVSVGSGQEFVLPVTFTPNGSEISSLVFSIDYDQSILMFDESDSNNDGIPDAIHFNLPAGFTGDVTVDINDQDGELDFMIADLTAPLSTLVEGNLLEINFQTNFSIETVSTLVVFSSEPTPSFGTTVGGSVVGETNQSVITINAGHRIYLPITIR